MKKGRVTVWVLLLSLMLPAGLHAAGVVRFAVFCDSRSSGKWGSTCTEMHQGVSPVLRPLVDSVMERHAKSPIALVLFPGDLIHGMRPDCGTTLPQSNRNELQHWLDVMRPLINANIKIRVTAGNHEVITAEPDGQDPKCSSHNWRYRPVLENLKVLKAVLGDMVGPGTEAGTEKGFTYSFDMGPAHFAILDAYSMSRNNAFSDDQLRWLQEDLGKAKQAGRKLFVAAHPPAFPGGGHMWDSLPFRDPDYRCDGRQGINRMKERDRFWKILEENGVIAYFCGHEHNIQVQKVGSVWHVVSGGVSPSLYPLNGSKCDKKQNKVLYDGALQNPAASVIWPWRTDKDEQEHRKKSFWGWCLVTVNPDRVTMEVVGNHIFPTDVRDFRHLKTFQLWPRK